MRLSQISHFVLLMLLLLFISHQWARAQSSGAMLRIACEGDNVGAEITVNDKFKGECPIDIAVPAGTVDIRALKKIDNLRERIFNQSFRVGDGVVKKLEVVLSPVQFNAEGQRIDAERRRAEQERQRVENERRLAAAEAARKAEEARKAAEAERAVKIAEWKRLAPIQQEERRKDRLAQTVEKFAAEGLTAGNGTAFRDCADCPEMVWTPHGKTVPITGNNDFHRWLSNIDIGAPFAVGKFEVTFDEWDRCVAERGCTYSPPSGKTDGIIFDTQWGRGRQPVINVSPIHARQYVTWLSQKTGQPYRLLTLAESHYVRYAGAKTAWPWGAQLAAGAANCPGCGSKWDGERPNDVGSFPPNAWGVHDMVGNVAEHVADCIGPMARFTSLRTLDALERAIDLSNAPKDGRAIDVCRSATGTSISDPVYSITGGSWQQGPSLSQYSTQSHFAPSVGFRVARAYMPKPIVIDPVSLKPYRDCATCPEMVNLPAGRFEMGSPYDITGRTSELEYPLRNVTVASFSIGKTEVTRGQYAAFITATKHPGADKCFVLEKNETAKWAWEQREKSGWQSPGFTQTDDHPVVCVSKEDAQAYAKWLTETTGKRYRLPSEAEWEYAARAGTDQRYLWGEDIKNACQFANIRDEAFELFHGLKASGCNDKWVYTAPVGQFKPTIWGLHDMTGNVSELIEDCNRRNYIGAPSTAAVWQDATCQPMSFAIRSANWSSPQYPVTARHGVGGATSYTGFRVVRENSP
jgi:formylglycine-generating enzyme